MVEKRKVTYTTVAEWLNAPQPPDVKDYTHGEKVRGVIEDAMSDLQRAIWLTREVHETQPMVPDVVTRIEDAILKLRALLAKGGA